MPAERRTLDESHILDLIDLRDGIGVISIYLGLTPDRAGEPKPGWPIQISNELRALRDRLDDPRHVAALESRIEGLGQVLDRFVDAALHGRGRALFAMVEGDYVETLAIQIPFRDRVVLDHKPYVRPLVAAVDEGRPAGIVSVHKHGTRVLEWRLGEAEEIGTTEFTVGGRDWREKTGPAPAQPLDSRPGGHRRDAYEDRVEENRLRFVREEARSVANEANRRGWDRLIVAGDPQLTKPFADELDPAGGEQLHITDLSWKDEAPNAVAAQAWELFKVLRRERAARLIGDARDQALSGNSGALGSRDVCACLNEGRVQQLLVDVDAQLSGYRTLDGLLYMDEQRPAAGADVLEEPYLIERMIERALQTGARVTPIDVDDAGPLREHDGVAALLRW